MRILVLSDLHLEFGAFEPAQTDADAVILAGDVWQGTDGIHWAAGRFSSGRCIYVAGNHEFYGREHTETVEACRAAAAAAGVVLLENDVTVIDGTRILGTTLWTDFRLHGGDGHQISAMKDALRWMNDFTQISMIDAGKRRRFRPADACGFHRSAREFLSTELARPFPGKTVVVTHFVPSAHSIPQKYVHRRLSAYDASRLEDMIVGYEPDLWVHGHIHESRDYRIGRTRIVCNPRGYVGHQLNPKFDPGLIV